MIDTNFLLPILKNENRHDFKASGGHILCPYCKVRTKLYTLSDGRRKCKRCGKKFSRKSPGNSSALRLQADVIMGFCLDWSALRTAKLFQHDYHDVLAGYMAIRQLLVQVSGREEQLKGTVECDESYFGGVNRKRNKKYRKLYVGRGRGTDKTPVFGILERKGRVVIELLGDFADKEITSIIEKKVKGKSSVMTDEFSSYKGLAYKGSIHRFVEHSIGKNNMYEGKYMLTAWKIFGVGQKNRCSNIMGYLNKTFLGI